jgi:hypothetical protein
MIVRNRRQPGERHRPRFAVWAVHVIGGTTKRRALQERPDQPAFRHVLHPEVLNAPSLLLIVTVAGPRPRSLAMIESKLPLVSFSRSQ